MSRLLEFARIVWPSPSVLPLDKLDMLYRLIHRSSYASGHKDGRIYERDRLFAMLETDPSALWRDQGFQEWRRNRGADAAK